MSKVEFPNKKQIVCWVVKHSCCIKIVIRIISHKNLNFDFFKFHWIDSYSLHIRKHIIPKQIQSNLNINEIIFLICWFSIYFWFQSAHLISKHGWSENKQSEQINYAEKLRGTIDEFMAWHISGVASCNLTFPLESLSFFSIMVLRLFWGTDIICVCFSTSIENRQNMVFERSCWWRKSWTRHFFLDVQE